MNGVEYAAVTGAMTRLHAAPFRSHSPIEKARLLGTTKGAIPVTHPGFSFGGGCTSVTSRAMVACTSLSNRPATKRGISSK